MTRIALFGCGRGTVHAESVTAHPRAELVWVCDPMEGPAKELAARHGAQATGNVATVLAEDARTGDRRHHPVVPPLTRTTSSLSMRRDTRVITPRRARWGG
jgi:hypothetical protein